MYLKIYLVGVIWGSSLSRSYFTSLINIRHFLALGFGESGQTSLEAPVAWLLRLDVTFFFRASYWLQLQLCGQILCLISPKMLPTTDLRPFAFFLKNSMTESERHAVGLIVLIVLGHDCHSIVCTFCVAWANVFNFHTWTCSSALPRAMRALSC